MPNIFRNDNEPEEEEDELQPGELDDPRDDADEFPELRPWGRQVINGRTHYEEDYIYDPLNRKGFD